MTEPPIQIGPIARIEAVDRFMANTGIGIVHRGHTACYRPATDEIIMPDERLFTGTDTR